MVWICECGLLETSLLLWTVSSVKCMMLSSSVIALSRSTRRISRMGTDLLRYWLYELLLLTFDEETVRSVIGVVKAIALLRSILSEDGGRFLTVS